MDPITANQEERLSQQRNRGHVWDLPYRWLGLPIMELFRLMHFFPGRNRNKQNYLPFAREGRKSMVLREQRAARAARVSKVRQVPDPFSQIVRLPNTGYWGKARSNKRPDVEYGQPYPLLGLKYNPNNTFDPMRELNALFARLG